MVKNCLYLHLCTTVFFFSLRINIGDTISCTFCIAYCTVFSLVQFGFSLVYSDSCVVCSDCCTLLVVRHWYSNNQLPIMSRDKYVQNALVVVHMLLSKNNV